MTRYTVVWVQSAEDELVDIWLDGDDRKAVAAATVAIDYELRTNANSKGDLLSRGTAVAECPSTSSDIYGARG